MITLSPTNLEILNSLSVLIISVLMAGVLIPQILLISFRKNLFDVPDERKIHKSLVPRLGGIAFKPVIFFSIVLLLGFDTLIGGHSILSNFAAESRPLAFSFCCIMVLYLVGIADDLIGVRYLAKFIIQIACGLMVIAGGLWMSGLHGLFGVGDMPVLAGYPLTILVVVFIINAINLIDGIDGLASGLSAVVMLFYGIIFQMMGQPVYAMLSFATLGVLLPFFYYNVWGNAERGRKIFMGDTGSLTVGMMICVLSLKMIRCDVEGSFGVNNFVVAYSPLIVPCFDVVRVYMHRVRNGRNPFLPDKNHIHHKMLALGMPQRVAMVTIVMVSAVFTLMNFVLSAFMAVTWILLIDVIVWTIANIAISRAIRKRSKK